MEVQQKLRLFHLGGIVTSESVRVGWRLDGPCNYCYIRKTYNLTIGERTAEAIKIEIGSARVIDE